VVYLFVSTSVRSIK